MHYKEMINHLPFFIYGIEFDPTLGIQAGYITYANTALTKYIGYTENEIISMGFNFCCEIIHPDDLQKAQQSIATLLSSGAEEHTCYCRVRSRGTGKYEIMKKIVKIVSPVANGGSIQFIATMLLATSEEVIQFYLNLKLDNDLFDSLSRREKEIAILITEGKNDNEIADRLFISGLTVKTHRTNIRKKLKVKNTAEMTTYLVSRFKNR
jgi:PAS domain S-box-containing protein